MSNAGSGSFSIRIYYSIIAAYVVLYDTYEMLSKYYCMYQACTCRTSVAAHIPPQTGNARSKMIRDSWVVVRLRAFPVCGGKCTVTVQRTLQHTTYCTTKKVVMMPTTISKNIINSKLWKTSLSEKKSLMRLAKAVAWVSCTGQENPIYEMKLD